jgi:hypothetical protein
MQKRIAFVCGVLKRNILLSVHPCQISVYIHFLTDSSAAKSTQKNQEEESPQAAADSTATKDNSNAIHCCKPSLPGSNKIPALAMIQPQQKLASDEHMDQALAVTSFKEQTGQRSSVQADASAAEKNPASLTHQTATKTAVPTTITTTTNITTDIATATAAAAITSNTPTSTTATATATTTTEVTDVRGMYVTSVKLHEFQSSEFFKLMVNDIN